MGRGPRTPPMLEVRQMFEPTRLAAACLEAAYAPDRADAMAPGWWRPELHGVSGLPSERAQAIMPWAPGGASWLTPRAVTMA